MDVDELLRESARRWRGAQPPSPDYDVRAILRHADGHRRRTSWLAVAAAAAVLLLVVAGVTVVRERRAATEAAAAARSCSAAQLGRALERVDDNGWVIRIGNVSAQPCSVGRGPAAITLSGHRVPLVGRRAATSVALGPGDAVDVTLVPQGQHRCPYRAVEPHRVATVGLAGGMVLDVVLPGDVGPSQTCTYWPVSAASWSLVRNPVPLCRAAQLDGQLAQTIGPTDHLTIRNRTGARCDIGLGPQVADPSVFVSSRSWASAEAVVLQPRGTVSLAWSPFGKPCAARPLQSQAIRDVGVPAGSLGLTSALWEPQSGSSPTWCTYSTLLWTVP